MMNNQPDCLHDSGPNKFVNIYTVLFMYSVYMPHNSRIDHMTDNLLYETLQTYLYPF